VLDTVISLRRPADYEPSQGARFEVHLEKARGVTGADAEPFSAVLVDDGRDGLTWATAGLADTLRARADEMLADGMSIRDAAEETGLSRSAVHRMKKRRDRAACGEATDGRQH
jgi:putative DNA primase/helicase